MEKRQQPGHGKATAGRLFAGRADLVLPHRGIGPGAPGGLDEENAMAMPAPVLQGRGRADWPTRSQRWSSTPPGSWVGAGQEAEALE